MLKSHEKFHSAHGKRLILVADDELINREILGMILANDYDVIYAADGQETMDQIINNKDDLSLVLLDLMMPKISGLDVLRSIKAQGDLKHIPVIVLTADQNAEVDSLSIGAIDYIPKPYPQAEIILARILKAIELSEDRDIIQSTERDPLTGLYNKEYFYRYSEQYDQHHRDADMDAIIIDINHFHMINERFGTQYGDEILKKIGEQIKSSISSTDGIVCRREADTFMIYCPHGLDYKMLLDNAAKGIAEDEIDNNRVRIRMGIYQYVDKALEIERRFDRAKMAADTVRSSFTKSIALYDNTLHERELYAEQLIDDFNRALSDKEFVIYYQPKFDIRPNSPTLSSMEALVRWQHPELGFISPGVFIPLFEDNGLIQKLDYYVWKETASQIKDWKDRLNFCVPVSVNVSRIDMYDPELVNKLKDILTSYNLTPSELMLEITESAYTQDSEQIINTVNTLREIGFMIEMDDFGTGYSSLNMISALPIDALKLDMLFIRSAFKDQTDTRMLEVIIDIADHLSVPVIAEGVETKEQLDTLKELGCDIVQGYYFSKPVPASEFESFLTARRDLDPEGLVHEKTESYDNYSTEEIKSEVTGEKHAFSLRRLNIVFLILIILFAAALAISDLVVIASINELSDTDTNRISAELAAGELMDGSDYLTENVRLFTITGDLKYMEAYFEEAQVTRRRENALASLDSMFSSDESQEYKHLMSAMEYSSQLMVRECQAMRLTQLAFGYSDDQMNEEVLNSDPDIQYEDLSSDELKDAAINLVFDDTYVEYKELIRENISLCTELLIFNTAREIEAAQNKINTIWVIQIIILILLVATILIEVFFISTQILMPLNRMASLMRDQTYVTPSGALELRFVAGRYNEVLSINQKAQKQLSYEASHDSLTGLFNRSAYEMFMESLDLTHVALLIIDVDHFKTVNDTYGHDIGDLILKRVANVITESFRSVDFVCRLGGDEFVVIMTRANSSMSQLVTDKISRANRVLQNSNDSLPATSLSVGVAFSDRKDPQGDIFKDADTALYHTKENGRCGCSVFGEF